MTTIKEQLIAHNFDFINGRIILQTVEDGSDADGRPTAAYEGDGYDQHINREYHSGYGSPQCPRFIAKDAVALYFPYQYDGSTGIVRVLHDISAYLDISNPTPYPGG